jgi:hypothetical protein
MGTYAGVDCKLTLCPLKSRLQHVYLMPESTLYPSQGLWIWPLSYNSDPKLAFSKMYVVYTLHYVIEVGINMFRAFCESLVTFESDKSFFTSFHYN